MNVGGPADSRRQDEKGGRDGKGRKDGKGGWVAGLLVPGQGGDACIIRQCRDASSTITRTLKATGSPSWSVATASTRGTIRLGRCGPGWCRRSAGGSTSARCSTAACATSPPRDRLQCVPEGTTRLVSLKGPPRLAEGRIHRRFSDISRAAPREARLTCYGRHRAGATARDRDSVRPLVTW